MIDLGREIGKRTARRQRGIRLTKGARFVRGMTPISIVSTGVNITFDDLATGEIRSLKRQDFLGVILTRLPLTGVPIMDPIVRAWDIAGSRRVDYRLRVMLLKQIASELSGDDRDMVYRWVDDLENNREPKWNLGSLNAKD